LAYVVRKSRLKAAAAQAAAVKEERKTPVEEGDGVESALPLDVLSLEVGYELIRAVDPSMRVTLVERIATHLAEVARANADQILGRAELQSLLDVFSKTTPKLAEDLVPNLLSFGEVLKVMRNLLRESVSIRELCTLREALLEAAPSTRDPEQLTELVRQKLSRSSGGCG
jgi:flagellar biosynthesis component FlhA